MLRISRTEDGKPTAAIGDIHGESALLHDLLSTLEAHGRDIGGLRIVTLGDYVDRGERTKDVIERLLQGPEHSCNDYVHLLGNHDEIMLRAWHDPSQYNMSRWIRVGGMPTLMSYGLDDEDAMFDGSWKSLIPEAHVRFLEGLLHAYADAQRIFVHAGLKPGVELHNQDEYDMLWIREGFLDVEADFGRMVVHGHTARAMPDVRSYRLNVDTSACTSGTLTAVVFGEDMRFVQSVQRSRTGVPASNWRAPELFRREPDAYTPGPMAGR